MSVSVHGELRALHALAHAMGVHTRYTDGLCKRVDVAPETLMRVCRALGAPIERPRDAADALRAHRAARSTGSLPPVLVAWDGVLSPIATPPGGHVRATVRCAEGEVVPLEPTGAELRASRTLPLGYHDLSVEVGGGIERCRVIAAPVQAWRRPGSPRSWGVGTHLAALRSARSRSLGDIQDLACLCRWVRERGGDLVTVLPLLPTFNTEPPEPSPYSPVSRLFWSELILDLGDAHRASGPVGTLDVQRANAEVRAALPAGAVQLPTAIDEELAHYARFRGAQARLGRNWRDWPTDARAGRLRPEQVDAEEEHFHLAAQTLLRRQLHDLRQQLERDGMRLGLDLAVGVHPDGYDPWSRQALFGEGMSVGAPPDQGFPSGQDWGFTPVLPEASRREGHRYLAASIAHQASLAGLLRIDHIMAWTRLYWIPHGMGLREGTYVSYPAEELFAILTLESNRYRCEVVGENLGTVPREIDEALPRHRIWGMYLAEFQASSGPDIAPPTAADTALVGTHDTPTFAGWLAGNDVAERVQYGLLAEPASPGVREERARAARWLADQLNSRVDEPREFLAELLDWLGRSESPLVVPWLEDLWLEDRGVNLPGTRSSVRPNWQRPMSRLLEEIFTDADVDQLIRRLHRARHHERSANDTPPPRPRPTMGSLAAPSSAAPAVVRSKPRLSFWDIWNMSFGFLGIQIGFALQNANVSRIFETLGAKVEDIPILWIAAPTTGLLVQPLVGYASDRTWTRLGRRRPYFLVGAILASLALLAMPNSPSLWVAAGMLWIMDASINVSMEPFRAFVGDNLPSEQRTTGFAMQSLLIGSGAVAASILPWLLTKLGVSNQAAAHEIPASVRLSFYLGAAVFMLAVLWTVLRSREYSPDEMAAFAEHQARESTAQQRRTPKEFAQRGREQVRLGGTLLAAGILLTLWLARQAVYQVMILSAGLGAVGVLLIISGLLQQRSRYDNGFVTMLNDFQDMPPTMRQLAGVQFFSWFALFAMWIYTTPAVTSYIYHTTDTTSSLYNEGANWVGVSFGTYNGVAAVAAFLIPALASRTSRRVTHALCLLMGALGLLSVFIVADPRYLLASMVGVGVAWASILSMPYAILCGALPPSKLGYYMGVFNFFIVIPQIVAAALLGFLVGHFFGGQAIYALAIGGASLVLAAVLTLRVEDRDEVSE